MIKVGIAVKLKMHIHARHNGKMRNYYRILDPPLGQGAFAEVRKCIYKEDIQNKKSATKQFRAVKILNKAHMEEDDKLSFLNEVCIMLKLQKSFSPDGLDSTDAYAHPNILKLEHYFDEEKRFLLVTELCEGGELFDYIKRKDDQKYLEKMQVASILKQLLSAVNFMHKRDIIHQDLKPENILIEDSIAKG